MDEKTKAAVTKALDSAITNVAEEYFNWLIVGLDQQEIADEILALERKSEGLLNEVLKE